MTEAIYTKHPDDVLDYPFDWVNDPDGRWLEVGETISSYVVTPDSGLTKDSDSESGGIVTPWFSGGTTGTSYNVDCKIITSLGRTKTKSMTILME